jgi:hypothetical protein
LATVCRLTKFTVDVVGAATGTGVRLTKPAADGAVTVRLPVMAMALDGTLTVESDGNLFVTWSVRGFLAVSGPIRPTP